MPHQELHYVHRTGWLRAAVLGANDGLISTASLVVGVAAASSGRAEVLTAAFAGWAAGAMAMAAGEFVSVSSQADLEAADLERERCALDEEPRAELDELAKIYEDRGLDPELSQKVAEQLMARDALSRRARPRRQRRRQAHPGGGRLGAFLFDRRRIADGRGARLAARDADRGRRGGDARLSRGARRARRLARRGGRDQACDPGRLLGRDRDGRDRRDRRARRQSALRRSTMMIKSIRRFAVTAPGRGDVIAP